MMTRTIAGVRALALDGKALKKSSTPSTTPRRRQVLSAFATDSAPCAGAYRNRPRIQREFRGAQKLLRKSILQTASSRSTPCTAKKELIEAAAANAHLIVQLKEHQPSLHGRVKTMPQGTAALGRANDRRQIAAIAMKRGSSACSTRRPRGG